MRVSMHKITSEVTPWWWAGFGHHDAATLQATLAAIHALEPEEIVVREDAIYITLRGDMSIDSDILAARTEALRSALDAMVKPAAPERKAVN